MSSYWNLLGWLNFVNLAANTFIGGMALFSGAFAHAAANAVVAIAALLCCRACRACWVKVQPK